jgi:AcrR family transcriptional regulator
MDASVADIARRAGSRQGTVFRHFATKDDLLAAIVLDRIDELNSAGEPLLAAADPGVALLMAGIYLMAYAVPRGMESVFLDMQPTGPSAFAPAVEARRSLFSARR